MKVRPALPDDLLETYSSGKCMYLAAALHRRYGLDIQITMEDCDPTYVAHAWVTDKDRRMCWDADGCYPMNLNGWAVKATDVETLSGEQALFERIRSTAFIPPSLAEWQLEVLEALAVVDRYFGRPERSASSEPGF
ncbi:hypothetical protein ACYPKM_04680 [Pseudomonas aeruginosa]